MLVKDLKLRGGSGGLIVDAEAKNIRLFDRDHETECRIDGVEKPLSACFVKKA